MTVPKGMSSSSISSRFPVPPAPQGETLQQPVDLMPPTVS